VGKKTNPITKLQTSFDYYTQDIDEVLSKPFLKVAIVSHITGDTGYPQEFVRRFIDLVYLSDHI